MTGKLNCNNINCKFSGKDGCTAPNVTIGANNNCESFEKGLHYYYNKVWNALSHSNFIIENDMTEDMKIGLYYVMKTYRLGFEVADYGLWRVYKLKDGNEGEALTYSDIINRDIDEEAFKEICKDFKEGKLPKSKEAEHKKERQPFGWLSPTGTFREGEWGKHDREAEKIIEENSFTDEFEQWKHDDNGRTARDFITDIKGYVLIHNPAIVGGYIVSHTKPLTKHQKEFLYTYFMEIGDTFKAESFITE